MEETTTTENVTETSEQTQAKQFIGNIDLNSNQVREALTGYLMHSSEQVRTLAERQDILVECNFSWNIGADGLRATFFAVPSETTTTTEDVETADTVPVVTDEIATSEEVEAE